MIDIQHSNERNFCGAIMKAILDMADHERKTLCFNSYLTINGKLYEKVI